MYSLSFNSFSNLVIKICSPVLLPYRCGFLPPPLRSAAGRELLGKAEVCCVFSLSSLVFLLLSHLVSWAYDTSRMDGGMLKEVRGA